MWQCKPHPFFALHKKRWIPYATDTRNAKKPTGMNKLLLLPLVLSMGCASLPGEKISKIQNREIAYVIKGEGNPTVVLETGLGPTMSTWDAVYEDVARVTRVFAITVRVMVAVASGKLQNRCATWRINFVRIF